MKKKSRFLTIFACLLAVVSVSLAAEAQRTAQQRQARHILNATGVTGGLVVHVGCADGGKRAEYELDSPPVFDGMAAANGRLYLVNNNGKIICFGAN